MFSVLLTVMLADVSLYCFLCIPRWTGHNLMKLATLNVGGSSDLCTQHCVRLLAQADVLCLTETWASHNSIPHGLAHDIGVCGPAVRDSNRHQGGIRLLSGPAASLRYRTHLYESDAQIVVAQLSSGMLIIGAYIAPLRGRSRFNEILAWVRPWLRGSAVLLGDLNARHTRWDTNRNAYGTALVQWTEANRATIYAPRQETYISGKGSSTIDLLIARGVSLDEVSVIPGIYEGFTDHRLVVGSTCPKLSSIPCRIPRGALGDPSRRLRAAEYYKEHIPTVTSKAETACSAEEVDAAFRMWQTVMLQPWRDFCQPCPRLQRPGWTRELDQLAAKRTRLIRQAEKGDAEARLAAKSLDREIKRRHRARQRRLARHSRTLNLHVSGAPSGNAVPQTLDTITRHALATVGKSTTPPPDEFLRHLNEIYQTDEVIACGTFQVDLEFTIAMEKAVLSMAKGRAAGPDGIPPCLLHIEPTLIAGSLTALWGGCGRTGTVPSGLLIGRVTAVHKKGDKHLAQNYRPITVLNVARRAISAALDVRIRKETTFHHCQWGFRRKMGAEHAIAHLQNARNTGNQHIIVLDMSSAYDIAPRRSIAQFAQARLPRDLYGMTMSLLSPGKIHISGKPDRHLTVTSGVPQGDPVSPSLFNFLMDDLLESIDRRFGIDCQSASCYADDVLLLARDRKRCQDLLDVCSVWADHQRMRWNVAKSAELCSPNHDVARPLKLSNRNLPVLPTVRYLGIEVAWDGVSHGAISSRIEKAAHRLAHISRSRSIAQLPYTSRRYIAIAHVLSMVDYCIHLCPLPASTRAKAAQLERRLCGFILNTRIPPHALIRARALARISPIPIRRKSLGFRRAYAAQQAILDYSPSSLHHSRGRTLLNSPILQDITTDAPKPHLHRASKLRETLICLRRTEWRRATIGCRPIPHTQLIPAALHKCPPHLSHVIARFYLNTIPKSSWLTISDANRARIRSLLCSEQLQEREKKSLHDLISTLAQNMH